MNDRVGEIRRNKETLGGYEMKIIEYISYSNILIEFQDKYRTKVHTSYGNFKEGSIRNPYHPSVFNVGYIGEGDKKPSENGKGTDIYKVWSQMLRRCYDPYYINRQPTYKDCFVEEYFHNFQNFAKWYEENYYEIPNEKMGLDKDILIKNNKMYSRETMIFVPQRINNLFTKCNSSRGKTFIGVTWHKRDRKFDARCSVLANDGSHKIINIGRFDNEIEAFLAYKKYKENYVKQVADEYKDFIPKKLYDALYRYEVEIND